MIKQSNQKSLHNKTCSKLAMLYVTMQMVIYIIKFTEVLYIFPNYKSNFISLNKSNPNTVTEHVVDEQSPILNISESGHMLPNTMSLAPKIDEIRHSVLQTDVDFASLTETTWLTDFVHDNVIQIPGYNVMRKNR